MATNPYNRFADLLHTYNDIDIELANRIARTFDNGDPDKRAIIIEQLELSHSMVGAALYGSAMYGSGDQYNRKGVA